LPPFNKGENMKKAVLSIALACVAPFAWAQVSETTTTTTTTDANGTITEYTPGSAIVLRETSGPVRYRFGKTVTYVTRSGKVLDPDVVRTKIKVGVPVRVHYTGTGDAMMVDRVIVDED
jgi:UDP-N-acetylmuramyl tripeptide synthase